MATISEVKQLEKLTRDWESRLRDAFLQSIMDVNSGLNVKAIIALIEAGNIEQVIREISITSSDFAPLVQEMASAFQAAGKQMTSQIPRARVSRSRQVKVQFNVRNPEAEQWLKERSSKLITEIVDDTRNNVRNFLTVGLEAGNNPRKTALELVGRLNDAGQREGGIIGLTSGQEKWARAYREELSTGKYAEALGRGLRNRSFDRTVAKAVRTGKPIPQAMIDKMVLAYRNNALRYRAENIARTETLEAVNEAQHNAINQGIESGAIAKQDLLRFVVTAGDERVRPEHKRIPGMNRSGVQIDEPFKTPSGPKLRPPFDVNCRCQVRMRINYFRGLT